MAQRSKKRSKPRKTKPKMAVNRQTPPVPETGSGAPWWATGRLVIAGGSILVLLALIIVQPNAQTVQVIITALLSLVHAAK